MNVLLSVLAVIGALLLPLSRIHAASCSYSSTQARVQNNIQVPWAPSITVGCDRSFNVGSFHNGTGQFANDTVLNVTGPYYNANYRNGDTVRVGQDGTYTLTVSTPGQDGNACMERATVNVTCNQPPPPLPGRCSYGSTQARVQNNITVPWSPTISVGCERVFNVGSFHNGTGQFSNDTSLYVSGPGIGSYYANGNTVRIPDTITNGTYTLYVNTNNQSGPACSENASVSFTCNPPPAQPANNTTSTQARVQQNIQTPWVSSLSTTCNQTFTVGSFHNGTGQFATDTHIRVTDPFGFVTDAAKNGSIIRAFFPGIYRVDVTTNNQGGPAFRDQATVTTICPSYPTPQIWISMLQQFMVGN